MLISPKAVAVLPLCGQPAGVTLSRQYLLQKCSYRPVSVGGRNKANTGLNKEFQIAPFFPKFLGLSIPTTKNIADYPFKGKMLIYKI